MRLGSWTAWRDELARLPELLAHHLGLSLLALVLGVLLSLGLAVLGSLLPRLRRPLLGAVALLQTVPALALLALMVPLLGAIGFGPALVALLLYSMLPVLRNALTALAEVDPAAVEAGTALGMTPVQLLLGVRLPLALPLIVAGVRTACVWVVGMATLATAVGAVSLGQYIFGGLQTQNHVAVLVGCGAVALLALGLDGLIGVLERAARERRAGLALGGGLALGLVSLAALAPLLPGQRGGGERVRIGAKTFTEQYLLARVIERALDEHGLAAERLESLGSTVLFDALVAGRIDCCVDYSGTLWANHMGREDVLPAPELRREVTDWLAREHGVQVLGALGFEDAYALAMRRTRAEELGITSLADLALRAPELGLGADYEFLERPEWRALRAAYGLSFARQRPFDPALMVPALLSGEVDVISAFTSDGRIAAHDLVLLTDPRGALLPYDALLLLSPAAARRADWRATLSGLCGAIDDATMREANRWVDVDGQSVERAAGRLWERLVAARPR